MKKRILFITQDLGRTGSEMVLWYLLINLDREKYEVSVFCLRKGALYDLLPDYIEKNILYKSSPDWSDRAFRRLIKLFGVHPLTYQLKRIQQRFKADVWYVNTIAVPEVLEIPKPEGVKMITHIHEYLYAFSEIKAKTLQRAMDYSDAWIGCSDMVCEKLVDLKQQNVFLQYSFVDTETIHTDPLKIAAIKEKLGILPGDQIWVVSGGTKYMKGLDQVLPILEHFKAEPVKIIWLGAQVSNALELYVRTVAEEKYPGRLLFAGALAADYYNYMSAATGLLLLSREETFSLVMIEAAYLGLPIVAFDIGIASAFIQKDMGTVAKNRNLDELILGMEKVHEGAGYSKVSLRNAAMAYSAKQQLPLYEQLLAKVIAQLTAENQD
ncbi:glycosyltransferase involved in cell wall biosynthesis [Pedobacter sp. AK017]|uniref:glycosyltransferase n=1 Tax=Pedobacter sp. AK017 TaxID=2723073 RepID=UPI00161874A2|nr:glycosyltransferase [Pedobacter sp. AK017]MBB5437006.1 glycosyltransferase involved in cell wall biosynthesis [Pedobacter sp. AK017]